MKVLTVIALAKYIHDTPSLAGRTLRRILVLPGYLRIPCGHQGRSAATNF